MKKKEERKKNKSKEKEEQDKKLAKKGLQEKPAKAKRFLVSISCEPSRFYSSVYLLILSLHLLSVLMPMKNIRVEKERCNTAVDIRQASGIQDSDYTINLLLDKAKYEKQIKSLTIG